MKSETPTTEVMRAKNVRPTQAHHAQNHTENQEEIDPVEALRLELNAKGLNVPYLNTDGGFHRCGTADKPNKTNGVYRCNMGGAIPYVMWWNWAQDPDSEDGKGVIPLTPEGKMTAEQKQYFRERAIQDKQEFEKWQEEQHAEAKTKAQKEWEALPDATAEHGYYITKGISFCPVGVKVDKKNRLVMPIVEKNTSGVDEVQSLLYIAENGDKYLLEGGKKQGGFFPIGLKADVHENLDTPICIAEGLSTAISIFEATAYPCIVAIDAYNLDNVARITRQFYPHHKIILCADNDLKDGTKKNVGVDKATKAARDINGLLAICPLIDGRKADFNDLHAAKGVSEVKNCIDSAVNPNETPPQEAPLPLHTETVAPEEFPLECLGERLSSVAQNVATGIGINVGAVVATMLAVLSLCSQGLANIVLNGRMTPLSLFIMILAKSGSGKTTLDTILTKAIRNFERNARQAYEEQLHEWTLDMRAYHAEVKKIERSNMKYEEKKHALKALGEAPKKPREPRFLYANATIQGLYKRFKDAMPSLGLFADEGTTVIGGHSMKNENRTATIGFQSDIFSTGRADKTVSGEDGSSFIEGIRLTMSIMLQHIIALPLFADAVLMAQGILARFLVTEIPSTPRQYVEFDTENNEDLQYFYSICTRLLNIDFQYNKTGGLLFRELHVTPEAKSVYVEFFNRLEILVTDDKALASIHPFGKRGAEQALRIAGVLTLAENPTATYIETNTMNNAVQIAFWFLSETLRITGLSETDVATADAERILTYLKEKSITETTDRLIRIHSPVRNKDRAAAAIKTLLEHGYLQRLKKGSVVDGKTTDQGLKVVLS